MFGIFSYMGTLGHYLSASMVPKHRGKGHNKQAHKNNYKQKLKKNRGGK